MAHKYFVIYGERNSGTKYLETVLTGKSCSFSYDSSAFNAIVINPSVPNTNNTICRNIYGNKHFFGFYNEQIKKADSNIVFVGIVRNPYDWIMALYYSKYHIPPENKYIIGFLKNEWYSIHLRGELMNDRDFDTKLRYKNIFAMRCKKLKYLFETMPSLTSNYELVKYEDLCADPMRILVKWSNKYNLELNKNFLQPINKKPYKIEPEIKQIIDDNIDWEIENKVGYFINLKTELDEKT